MQVVFSGPRQVTRAEPEIDALARDEALLRTRRTLISTGTELATYRGDPWRGEQGTMPKYPARPGYASVGEVVAAGEDVRQWRVGDRVASYKPHARFAKLKEGERAWTLPDEISDDSGTFCTLSATVLNGVRMGAVGLGDTAVVLGLGLLGQFAAQFLRLEGARPVLGVELDASRRERAERVSGVSEALDGNADPARIAETVRARTGGRGGDVIYEATGLTGSYDLAFDMARRRGRVIGLGSPRWPASVNMLRLHLKGITLVGAHVSTHPSPDEETNRWNALANGERFVQLARDGEVDVDSFVTHRVPASEAEAAFDLLDRRAEECFAVVLDWHGE